MERLERERKNRAFGYSMLFMLMMAICILTGCASADTVYNMNFSGSGQMTGALDSITFKIVKGIYDYVRDYIVLMIVVSEVVGIFIFRAFAKRNKAIKKRALFGWMLAIPIMHGLIFFAMAFYLNKFY